MPLGKSARFYASHPESRKKKIAYDTKYEDTPERIKYRSKLSVLRKKKNLKGSKLDLSHKSNGTIVLEARSKNRARNGHGNNGRLKP